MKKLVVYYSFEGNTKFVAEEISKAVGADLLELKPVKDIKSHGFMKFVWGGRQVMMKKEPELQEFNVKVEDYDIIFIGTPVWAFTFAPALRTFFSKFSLEGKKIGLFCTFDGNYRNVFEDMQKSVKGDVIGKKAFMKPLKNKEKCSGEAVKWAELLLTSG
ncbi:NAD(P)H-dependent oxidoreductase [Candidatus Woesearchaeota archaeon]|nr:NAD(P)H-dependent oxidoreductase [Candidatus Woesearchaeota archaeon]